MNDSRGHLTSTMSGRGMLKGWVCSASSWIGRLIYPPGKEPCCISCSSGPWWTMRDLRGGPLPASMSRGYRCYNPSVFALLLVPPGTKLTGRYTRIWAFRYFRALTENFDSKWADVGKPLVRQLGRYLSWPRVDPIFWRESQGQQGTAGQSRL